MAAWHGAGVGAREGLVLLVFRQVQLAKFVRPWLSPLDLGATATVAVRPLRIGGWGARPLNLHLGQASAQRVTISANSRVTCILD